MSNIRLLASNFTFSPVSSKNADSIKRRREITIISFSRSICRKELAALIGVTGKPYPSCLSCHSHPIRPCGAPSPSGEGCDTRIPSSKKGGEAATRALNPEPNESKVKRGCDDAREKRTVQRPPNSQLPVTSSPDISASAVRRQPGSRRPSACGRSCSCRVFPRSPERS